MSSLFYQKSETPCIIFHLPFSGDLTAISADVINTIKRVLRTKYMACIEDSDTGTRYWLNLVDGEVILYGGGSGELSAGDVGYNNTTSGLTADDVQEAIDEVNTKVGDIDAGDIEYDNTESGLTADDVQEAIDEVNGKATSAINKWTFPALTKSGDDDEIITGELVDNILEAQSPFIDYNGGTILHTLTASTDEWSLYGGFTSDISATITVEIESGISVTLTSGDTTLVYEFDSTTENYILDTNP